MNQQEAMKLRHLIELYPIIKDEQKDRIKILISGKKFIVQNRQLKNFPETLLGNEEKRRSFYDIKSDLYRFNRHPSVFESILYYYLNPGILIRPVHIEPEIFYEELRFWNIKKDLCDTFIEDDMIPLDNIRLLPLQKWRRIIWKLLTYPDSFHFPYGQLVIGIYILITFLSCLSFLNEVIPTISELHQMESILHITRIYFPLYPRLFYIIEILCITIISIEFNLRIISAPRLSSIFFDLYNFLDIIIIASGSICLINYHLHNSGYINNFLSFYYWLLILKSFRIYRLARHMLNVQLLYKSIALCLNEVCILIISIIFCMFLFGILIHTIDNSEPESNIRNILDGFWLAFITLTTLGYGDIYPRSFEARVAAGSCALIGIILFSMPTMIIFVKYTTLVQNKWKKNRNIHYIIST